MNNISQPKLQRILNWITILHYLHDSNSHNKESAWIADNLFWKLNKKQLLKLLEYSSYSWQWCTLRGTFWPSVKQYLLRHCFGATLLGAHSAVNECSKVKGALDHRYDYSRFCIGTILKRIGKSWSQFNSPDAIVSKRLSNVWRRCRMCDVSTCRRRRDWQLSLGLSRKSQGSYVASYLWSKAPLTPSTAICKYQILWLVAWTMGPTL